MKLFNHGAAKAQNGKGYIYNRCSTEQQLASKSRVIGYVRSATVEQNNSSQIETQIHKIIKYCQEKNLELNCIFVDAGKSGMNTDRQGLKSLLEEVDKKTVRYVLATDLSRIARNALLFQLIKDTVEAKGVEIIFTDTPIEDNSPESKFLDEILANVNAFYSKSLKRRQKKTNKIREIDCLNNQ